MPARALTRQPAAGPNITRPASRITAHRASRIIRRRRRARQVAVRAARPAVAVDIAAPVIPEAAAATLIARPRVLGEHQFLPIGPVFIQRRPGRFLFWASALCGPADVPSAHALNTLM
jgi:hypothetical protein